MKLFIPDLCEVLKCRVKTLIEKKSQGDPSRLMAGIADIRSVLSEMETVAVQLMEEIERQRDESEALKEIDNKYN